jgi:hypothetical protein
VDWPSMMRSCAPMRVKMPSTGLPWGVQVGMIFEAVCMV